MADRPNPGAPSADAEGATEATDEAPTPEDPGRGAPAGVVPMCVCLFENI